MIENQPILVQKLVIIFSEFSSKANNIDWSSVQNEKQLLTVLQTGEILCQISNGLIPNSIQNFHQKNLSKIKQIDNLNKFLNLCKTHGVPEDDLFNPSDLQECRNPNKILTTILTFIEKLQSKGIQIPVTLQTPQSIKPTPASSINKKISISLMNLKDAFKRSLSSARLNEEDPFHGIGDLDERPPKFKAEQVKLVRGKSAAFTEFELSPSTISQSSLNQPRPFKKDRPTSYSYDITSVEKEWKISKQNTESKIVHSKSCMAFLDILNAKEKQIKRAHLSEQLSVRDIWKLREELNNVRKKISADCSS